MKKQFLFLAVCTLFISSTIYAQDGLMEVFGTNSATMSANTEAINLPTQVELNSGESGAVYTHFNIRNETDQLHIDVDSDLFGGIPAPSQVIIDVTGDITTQGNLTLGNGASSANGTLRYDGTNLQVRLDNEWVNICTGACTPLDCNDFSVVSPASNQTFSQNFSLNGSNQVVIEIEFNRAVNTSSVVVGQNFNFSSGGSAVPGTISWNTTSTVATFTTNASYTSFCAFTPDCFMTLDLIGNGPNGIEDANGCMLDGDSNGVEGGNWTTTFGILG